jgi:hypothetical protein
MSNATTHHHAAAAKRGSMPLILALGLAAMVVSMAQTQVIPILSLLGTDLHSGSAGVSWVTTATLLSAAVFTPLLGRGQQGRSGDPADSGRTAVQVGAEERQDRDDLGLRHGDDHGRETEGEDQGHTAALGGCRMVVGRGVAHGRSTVLRKFHAFDA